MCKEFGADVVYTEFISSDGLIRDAAKSLKKLEITEAERPVGIQIYGHLIEPMVEAARMAEAAGPDIIDINFGCPMKKIAGRGAGSGMMRDVPLMVEMTRRIVQAVDHAPVTVKTRLGWDDENKNIEEIALRLQDVGIAALTIHGRARAQIYRGEADWTLIGRVKNNPAIRIPIIGNGDVDSGPRAAAMFDRYGVDGVMIGRATACRRAVDLPRSQALPDYRRGTPPAYGRRTGRNRQASSAQIGGNQRRIRRHTGNAPPPLELLQGAARFQTDPSATRHADRHSRADGHARLDRRALGRFRHLAGRARRCRTNCNALTKTPVPRGTVSNVPPPTAGVARRVVFHRRTAPRRPAFPCGPTAPRSGRRAAAPAGKHRSR